MKVAAVTLTKNEEPRIEECLKHLRIYVDFILIVDGESTDRTVEIAKKYADKVVVKPFSGSFAEEKNYARTLVPKDCLWILWVDADERFDVGLLRNIKEHIKFAEENGAVCWRFPRVNLPMDKFDSLRQVLYTRLSDCSFGVLEGCPLKRLISNNLEKTTKRLGKNISKRKTVKTKESTIDFTLNGGITLIQNIGSTLLDIKESGEKPIRTVIESGIEYIVKEIETKLTNEDESVTTRKGLKELNQHKCCIEKNIEKSIKKLTTDGERNEETKSFKPSEENVNYADEKIQEFLNFITESLTKTQKTGYERLVLLKSCSYCVLTAIGSHIINTSGGRDWPDYQVRLIRNSRDIEWRRKTHEVPYWKPENIPLDQADDKSREKRLNVIQADRYPIIHLPRRIDEGGRRSWW